MRIENNNQFIAHFTRKHSYNIAGFILFCFMGVFIFWHFKREKREEKLLENSLEYKATLKEKKIGNAHSPAYGYFTFFLNGKKIEFEQSGDFNFMKIGDTVLIKYAVEDHSVARVVDKFFMKKYRCLKDSNDETKY